MIPTLSAMTIDHLGFPSQRGEILLRGGLSDGGDAQEVRPGLQGGRGAAGPATRKPVAQVGARTLAMNMARASEDVARAWADTRAWLNRWLSGDDPRARFT